MGRGSSGANAGTKGKVSFAQIVNASKNSISFSKAVTVIPDGRMPQTGRKKDLEQLLNRNGINDVVVHMYRDKAGANDLERMKKLGFEVVAYYKGEQQEGSSIPPTDYYHMKRKGAG